MFRSRTDRISDLIDLHTRLDPSNINSLLENPTSIMEEIETMREFLKTEIESFSILIIDGLLELTGKIDIQFAEKVIEFNQKFFGEIIANAISKFYVDVGFDSFLKIIYEIKNSSAAIDGIEALFKKIIFDGEKHRTEACALTAKLQEIASGEDYNTLSAEEMLRATNMIGRLKPHARPIVRKMFYVEGMPLKEGEENGSSYPIFSQSGNWSENHLVMSQIIKSFKKQEDKYEKILNKK